MPITRQEKKILKITASVIWVIWHECGRLAEIQVFSRLKFN